jgi:hypothetical protein
MLKFIKVISDNKDNCQQKKEKIKEIIDYIKIYTQT